MVGIPEPIEEYESAVDGIVAFTVSVDGELAGFLPVNLHFERSAELHVLGASEQYHRSGIGRALLHACEEYCRERGLRFLQVKTLSPSRESDEYGRTRKFYLAMGFEPLETSST